MIDAETQYLNLLKNVLENGTPSDDRTGNGTLSIFGAQMRLPIYPHFPLLTTKKVYWKGVVHELLWFLKTDTNIKYLVKNNVNIWNDDAYRYFVNNWNAEVEGQPPFDKEKWLELVKTTDGLFGDLGPVYGRQWRGWPGNYNSKGVRQDHDQIANIIHSIKTNPSSRRHILSAWNVEGLDLMALPPCHLLAQFYVRQGKISCQVYIRSNDLFLGAPFNIASYTLLTYMIAHLCDLTPHELVYTIGDAHIYNGHIDAVKEQLTRSPVDLKPTVALNPTINDIDDFKYEDIRLFDYKHHGKIKAPLFT